MDFMSVRDRIKSRGCVTALAAYDFSRRFHVTDPRDRVYGLRGVMNHEERDLITPDYHKSEAEVFRDTTRSLLLHTNSLIWLSHARPVYETPSLVSPEEQRNMSTLHWHGGNPQTQRGGLPTWAVDWTLSDEPENDQNPHARHVHQLDTLENKYQASGLLQARFVPQPDPNILSLEGRVVGKIKSCVRSFQMSAIAHGDRNFPDRPIEQTFLMAYLMCFVSAITEIKSNTYKATGEPRADAIWRTLLANRWSVPGGVVQHGQPDIQLEQWISRLLALWKTQDPAQRYKWSSIAYDRFVYQSRIAGRRPSPVEQEDIFPTVIAWNSLSRGVVGRCFCTIEGEFLGLCPPTAKEGDLVVVLSGRNVPYVLRQADSQTMHSGSSSGMDKSCVSPLTTQKWHFIGEAYVHGRMNGEAVSSDFNDSDLTFDIA